MHRLSGLTVLCFAGTYALALAQRPGPVRRPRAGGAGTLTVGLTALGWLVQTAYLGNCWRCTSGSCRSPRSSSRCWCCPGSSAAIALYLIAPVAEVGGRRPVRAAAGARPGAGLRRALRQVGGRLDDNWGGWVTFWGLVHGMLLLLGAVFTCVAFLAGLMYLAQSRRLKREAAGAAPGSAKLPSLEQSERLNRAAITAGLPAPDGRPPDRPGADRGDPTAAARPRSAGTTRRSSAPWACGLFFAVLLHALFRPRCAGGG